MAAQLLEDAAFTIRIELPGDVEGHNADAVDGGALVWSLDLLSDQPRDLMARIGGGGGDGVSTIVTIVVVIALLIAAAAVIVRFRSRRRSAADA